MSRNWVLKMWKIEQSLFDLIAADCRDISFSHFPLQEICDILKNESPRPTSFLPYLQVLLDANNLPTILPPRNGTSSEYGRFIDFTLDAVLMEKIEDEVGVLN